MIRKKLIHNRNLCSAYNCCNREAGTLTWCDKTKRYIGLKTEACHEHGQAKIGKHVDPDHEEEIFIRDCLAWRESDPIFRTKITFYTPEQEAQINKEIDEHFARERNNPLSTQELPRAQPCQSLYTGKGSTITTKVNQYARQ